MPDTTGDADAAEAACRFGPFRLLPHQHLLLRDDAPVRLGSRAFAILCVLAERAGQVVGPAEIMARVWPGLAVDDSILRVHLTALRRALATEGAGQAIVNTPGRGYSLVWPVVREVEISTALPLARLFGRDELIGRLHADIAARRLTTLTGVGGIGKTSVALAAATTKTGLPSLFVDLAPLHETSGLPALIMSLLGVPVRQGEPMAGLLAALRGRRLLLILDNCEHVIEGAARFAEAALRGVPDLRILATSREALRAEGEHLVVLDPLGCPPPDEPVDAARLGSYPAVTLFWDRADLGGDIVSLSETELVALVEICWRLDGIPLAIELAAAQSAAFGLAGLAARLDQRFAVLTRGRRTALPRHRTLRATLDWSYDLLPADEQALLRRLAVFSGSFGAEAAHAVAAPDEPPTTTELRLASLLSKSLVVAERTAGRVRFRLLETMRAYAGEALQDQGEAAEAARRHGRIMLGMLQARPPEQDGPAMARWLADCAREINNFRVALDWAFSASGDMPLAVAMTEAAIPIWYHLSRIPECAARVMAALAWLDASAEDTRRVRMRFHAALGGPMLYARGAGQGDSAATWRVTLRLARELDDTDYQLRALWALWADHLNLGECHDALAMAEQFMALAADDEDRRVGARLLGVALHMQGRQAEARMQFEHMLAGYRAPPGSAHIMRFQFDQAALTRMMLARVLWVQGLPDQAWHIVQLALGQAVASGHLLSECNILAQSACPLALLRGDLGEAARLAARLRQHCAAQAYDVWLSYAECYAAEVEIRRGYLESGATALLAGLGRLRDGGYIQYEAPHLTTLIEGLTAADQLDEAAGLLARTMAHCERGGSMWCYPELLRLRAQIAVRADARDVSGLGERDLRASLTLAAEQGSLSWALRSAVSLTELTMDKGGLDVAMRLLRELHGRFCEGRGTGDLRRAAALLEHLGAHPTCQRPPEAFHGQGR